MTPCKSDTFSKQQVLEQASSSWISLLLPTDPPPPVPPVTAMPKGTYISKSVYSANSSFVLHN